MTITTLCGVISSPLSLIATQGGGEPKSAYDKDMWPLRFNFWPGKALTELWYGRKENAIHQWFVDNVQGGEDDCRDAKIPIEKLRELKDTLSKIIEKFDSPELADVDPEQRCEKLTDFFETVLPTQDGFFFGSISYDTWYIDEIRNLLNILTSEEPRFEKYDYYYRSSW